MTDVNDADIVVQYGAGVVEDDHIRAALTADGHIPFACDRGTIGRPRA